MPARGAAVGISSVDWASPEPTVPASAGYAVRLKPLAPLFVISMSRARAAPCRWES